MSLIDIECAPCGREGVWLAGGDVVVHERSDGSTYACLLPPRDVDRFTARQRASLNAAIKHVLAERAIGAAA